MLSNVPWGLVVIEALQAAINLGCLAITTRTLSDAVDSHRRIVQSGQNHGADVFAWASVRSKGANVAVQVLILAMGCDRLILLLHGYHPDLPGHFFLFGAGRTLIGVLVAATAYANMLSFRRLRNLQRSNP